MLFSSCLSDRFFLLLTPFFGWLPLLSNCNCDYGHLSAQSPRNWSPTLRSDHLFWRFSCHQCLSIKEDASRRS
jgi:hypothetical protein